MCESKCTNGCESTEITKFYMGDSFCSMDCVLTYIQVSTGDNFAEAKETYESNKDWTDPTDPDQIPPRTPPTMATEPFDENSTTITLDQANKELEDCNLFNLKCDKCGTPMFDYFYVNGTHTCSEQCRKEYITDEEYNNTDCGASDDVYYSESDLYVVVGDVVWDDSSKEYTII